MLSSPAPQAPSEFPPTSDVRRLPSALIPLISVANSFISTDPRRGYASKNRL